MINDTVRDYLLKRDLVVVYRSALARLLYCVQRKVKNGTVEGQLLCSLYDLYQYAERYGKNF